MKVDFITRHAIPNYGSILQTYATQKVLNKLGCDSEVINYIRMDETANKTIVTNCNIKENGILKEDFNLDKYTGYQTDETT